MLSGQLNSEAYLGRKLWFSTLELSDDWSKVMVPFLPRAYFLNQNLVDDVLLS